MKKLIFVFSVISFFVLCTNLYPQGNCKVLLPAIGDTYTGSCKQGMADGKGEAFGVDQYKGEFKKGLPDGIGTYIWQNGNKYEGEWKKGLREGEGKFTFTVNGRDSIVAGIWKEDKYVGKKEPPQYVITYKNSISRVSFVRVGDVPNVEYKFSRAGISSDIYQVVMQGSSGSELQETNFVGFERVMFPFTGSVRFVAPNALNSATINYELKFVINKPGTWIVTMYY
jgi:hypothetical protein